ncbi:acyl-CoA dehydrogenase family protein [Dactylosporangium sp. NPDC000555]|uniref:acyl-CoA dehydrogenase family protein n=1 Tax=Dactylosporangium sp. NPDC000555 TaxID=3154260 RepID=UPI0033195957
MNWDFTVEQERFRAEVRGLLRERPELVEPNQFFHGRGGNVRILYRALGARGWLSLAWPAEHGGAARSPAYEYILWDELAYARAARPDIAVGMVAKTIINHGTPEQRARYLPGIRAGEVGFALGYSEPEAGSDLRAVRTRAVRDADVYRVTGEKRWTSDAHHSRYLWLLCRASAGGVDAGRTLLILDLTAPGVTIRPIRTIDGHRLNEIFLDEVRVSVEDRVGAEGAAWDLIRDALALERHLMLLPGRVRRDYDDLVAWARPAGVLDDPAMVRRLRELAVDVAEAEVAALVALAAAEAGADATVPAAEAKLLGSTASQRIARAAFDAGHLSAAETGGQLELLWRETVMETIAGGTSEVIRSVIARGALGLAGNR